MKAFLCLVVGMLTVLSTTSFVVWTPTVLPPTQSSSMLEATKKKKSIKSKIVFGGAAMEPCPCGSSESYSRCCGRLHQDVNAYKSATAGQVVRARYSAYAKKQADFLMASTHPLHKDFNSDLKQWKDQIKLNMYDNFDLSKCIIVEESYNEDGDDAMATVKFVAELMLRETGEMTGFMETSQFERAKTHGGWLYLNGTMEAAPEDLLIDNLDTKKD